MKLKDGYTLMHEHVTIDLSRIKKDPDTHLDSFKETVEEFKDLYDYGVRNIVDVTNIGMGRDIEYVENVEKETGINIISSTGFYKEPFYPDFLYKKTEKELTDIVVKEIEEGISGSNRKAQIIGEIGTSKDKWTDEEMRVFNAMAEAQLKTNVPISTHTSLATLGKEQVDFLLSKGIDPNKIIIGHMDLSMDIDKILELLSKGVNVGFDTIGKNSYAPDEFRVEAIKEIKNKGYINQIVLSMDITRKSHLKINGGLGYSHIFTSFIPKLKESGLNEYDIDILLRKNPRRIFED